MRRMGAAEVPGGLPALPSTRGLLMRLACWWCPTLLPFTPACSSCLFLQASDRVYYLFQTLADMAEALAASPEGQQALAEAQQQLRGGSNGSEPAAAAAAGGEAAPVGKAGGKGGKGGKQAGPSPGAQLLAEVEAALADDFNTPLAIAAFSAPLKAANDLLHTKKVRRLGRMARPGARLMIVGTVVPGRRVSALPAMLSAALLMPRRNGSWT